MKRSIKRSLLRKKRNQESWFKYLISLLHLWLGLISSIVIFIVCLSGCLYAFKTQLEHLLYREFRSVESPVESIKLGTALLNFEGEFGSPTQVLIPEQVKVAIEITSFSKQNRGVFAYYHPSAGTFLGKQSQGSVQFFYVVLEVHRWLLVEKPGKVIVGVSVLIFIFMLFSGLVMWFPSGNKKLSSVLTIKWKAKFYRVNYDLHRVLGAYAALFLLVIALTGSYVSFHWMKNLLIQGLGGPSIEINDENIGQSGLSEDISTSFNALFDGLVSEQKQVKEPLPIDSLVYIAQRHLPNSGLMKIMLPLQESGFYTFYQYGDSRWTLALPDKLVLNQYGVVQREDLFVDLPLYKQFMAIAKPLHTGEIFGLASIILYFLVSLLGCSLPVTGFVIWWKKLK